MKNEALLRSMKNEKRVRTIESRTLFWIYLSLRYYFIVALALLSATWLIVENGARRIEAHIVGFEGNIYGQEITLYLVSHLREERKFGSREELVAQIERDRNKALDLLSIKE